MDYGETNVGNFSKGQIHRASLCVSAKKHYFQEIMFWFWFIFVKLRKGTLLSFALSVCSSASNDFAHIGRNLMKLDTKFLFKNLSTKLKFFEVRHKTMGTSRPTYIHDGIPTKVSTHSEGPATGHLHTHFHGFPQYPSKHWHGYKNTRLLLKCF
jgi:hypothetical protein